MIYIIKRDTLVPWENSISEFSHKGSIYDIIKSPKNTALERISEIVIDDGVIVTSLNDSLAEVYKELNTNTKELLLG